MKCRPMRIVWIAASLAVLPALGVAQQAPPGAGTENAVALVGDVPVTSADLDVFAKDRLTRLRNEEYTNRANHDRGILGPSVSVLSPGDRHAQAHRRTLRREGPLRVPRFSVADAQTRAQGCRGGGVCPGAGSVLGDARQAVSHSVEPAGAGPEARRP